MRKPQYIFDGILNPPLPLEVMRGDTGRHIIQLWMVDEDGEAVEPYDLREDSFRMHVRRHSKKEEILIEVPSGAFDTMQSDDAQQWEETNDDAEGRHDLLQVLIPKNLTDVQDGKHIYDIEFIREDEVYSYARGPYKVIKDATYDVPE